MKYDNTAGFQKAHHVAEGRRGVLLIQQHVSAYNRIEYFGRGKLVNAGCPKRDLRDEHPCSTVRC